ncbi:MAG: PfkB family carbohydrate kinase [Bryobacteraceae bacterium]
MTASEILTAISELNTLVLGDVCLDRWCIYDPDTAAPSRETGISRVGVVFTETTPGAAGTIANNLVALGVSRVTILGAIGDDGHGFELLRALRRRRISAELSVISSLIPTFTYTKLINSETGMEDLPRIDYIRTEPLPMEVEEELLEKLDSCIDSFDVVFVSDQAETESGGMVTPEIRRSLSRVALEFPKKVIWVDSRMRPEHFRNVIIKPNRDEAVAACLRQFGEVDLEKLRSVTESPLLVMTDSDAGVVIFREGEEILVKTKPEAQPVDICGAGDSFSAGAATALAVTGDPLLAARFGNMVASVTIMKKGTGTASPAEVLAAERNWPA